MPESHNYYVKASTRTAEEEIFLYIAAGTIFIYLVTVLVMILRFDFFGVEFIIEIFDEL
jgi:hypothetical protein